MREARTVASALLVTAGCWTSSSSPPPTAEKPAQVSARSADTLPARTIWHGRYQCSQGWTAMRLTLDVADDGRAVAIFDFGALADNPTVPPGSYRLVGRVEEAPAQSSLTLSPERWLSQPEGYVMVALAAQSDKKRQTLRGRIENPSCGELELERVHP